MDKQVPGLFLPAQAVGEEDDHALCANNRRTGAADVHGIDLGEPLAERDVRSIRKGLNKHQALFFREQPILSRDQHLALARNFG